jgi:hypothetical protein
MSNMIHPVGPDDDRAAGFGYDYDEDEKPRGRLRRPAIAIVAIAVLAGLLWFAYGQGPKHAPGEVPLIRADDTATKSRPNQPGGMAIPDQDKLAYDQGHGQPQVEKLLPAPETPLPRPVAAPPESDNTATNLPTGSVGAPPILPAGVTPPQPAASVVAAAPASSPPPVAAAVAPAPAPAVTTAPAKPPAAAPKPSVKVAAAATGGFRLQVGAMRSDDIAKQEWERIKAANKDLLGNLSATWPRVDLGAKGVFYRIQTTPIADAATADRLCNELKQRNVGCIIVRP